MKDLSVRRKLLFEFKLTLQASADIIYNIQALIPKLELSK